MWEHDKGVKAHDKVIDINDDELVVRQKANSNNLGPSYFNPFLKNCKNEL